MNNDEIFKDAIVTVSMSKWRSVKDKLPEENERVLTYTKYDEYKVDYIVNCPDPIWGCTLMDDMDAVLYWMPLPEPPKIENKHE